MAAVAGIDIGTTSVGLTIMDAEDGLVRRSLSYAHEAALASERPWERMQDPARIFALVQRMIRECGDDWRQVEAIGLSCQMHGIVYVDDRGEAVSPLYTWQDGRGSLPAEDGRSYADRLQTVTGYPLAGGYGVVTMYHQVENGEVPRSAVHLCTIGDYVSMQLCGKAKPVVDATNAAGIGMYDDAGGVFDRFAAEKAGLPSGLFPAVAQDGVVLGRTPDGKAVVCAIGDNQASFLGAVPSLDGHVLVNIGTGSQLSVYSRELASPGGGWECRPFPGGGYLLAYAALGGGKSYALLERFYREVVRVFAATNVEEPQAGALYARMNGLALDALTRGLALPQVDARFFGSREKPHVQLRLPVEPVPQTGREQQEQRTTHLQQVYGSIRDIDEDDWTVGQLTAGWLNGILDELLGAMERIPGELADAIHTVVGSGNGIRANPAMQLLLREKSRKPLLLPEAREEAAFGAAVHAAVAVGIHTDHASALRCMHQRTNAGS